MTRLTLISFLLLQGAGPACATTPLTSAGASGMCGSFFGAISRVPRGPVNNVDADLSRVMLDELKDAIASERAAQPAGLEFARPNEVARVPYEQYPDGFTWRFLSHENQPHEGRAAYYEALGSKFDRLRGLVGALTTTTKVHIVTTSNLTEIREALADPTSLVGRGQKTRRGFLAAAGGGVLGGLLGPTRLSIVQERELDAYDEKLCAEARATLSNTRAEHMRRVHDLLSHRAGEKEVKEALEAHVRHLDNLEKTGQPAPYGSRLREYLAVGEKPYSLLTKLNSLATASPDRFTVEGLQRRRKEYRNEEDSGLSSDELAARHRFINAQWSGAPEVVLGIGQVLASTGLGFAAGWFGSGMKARLRGPTLAPADLRELAAMVAPGRKPRAQVEWLWVGSNTLGGRHVDIVLKVDNRSNPPTVNLIGLGYDTPLDYWSAKAVHAARDDRAARLRELRADLVATHFRLKFGKDLEPVEELFREVARKKPDEENFAKFKAGLANVKTMDDVRRLRWVVETLPKPPGEESER